MAASAPDKDYYHRAAAYLTAQKGPVNSMSYNFAVWERQAADRAETFEDIDGFLNENLDLVTIQLGENASDLSSFGTDFEGLIRHIQHKAPGALVVVVGDFWESGSDRDSLKKAAADSCGAAYVSLDAIKGQKEYQCGVGTDVLGDDGISHKVEHPGVASHPNDEGMKYIADRIIEACQ